MCVTVASKQATKPLEGQKLLAARFTPARYRFWKPLCATKARDESFAA